ncbi:MAG TPA: acyltransferase [Vicinamibacterales bacterium]|nr:acyltransferase [Vicinamibacterales bacterium]
MAQAPSADDSRISQLDGIRGLAIALVLVWHDVVGLVQTTPGSAAAYVMRALSFTWAGVDLFFVLSGFLIGGILLDNRGSGCYFSTFYIRRACRIFPLYYGVLALFLLCAALVPQQGSTDWQRWLFENAAPGWAYASYLQNFTMVRSGMGANWMAVTWSLAVEEQFYLVTPLLVWLVPVRMLPYVLVTLIAAAPVTRIALHVWLPPPDIASYVLLPARWDSLFLGVLAAWMWRRPDGLNTLRRAVPLLRLIGLAGLAVLAGLMIARQNMGSFGMAAGGYTVIAICSLVLVLTAMLAPNGLVQRILRAKPLVWLGTISYGVYLFHRAVTGVMHGVWFGRSPRIDDLAGAVVTLLALGVTLTLAQLSAHFFERPIVNFGRRRARY